VAVEDETRDINIDTEHAHVILEEEDLAI